MNRKKWPYFLFIPIMVVIWFVTPPTNPVWLKYVIFAGIILFQTIVLALAYKWQSVKAEEEEPYFGLTEKLYTVTLFTSMGIYIKGLWASLPSQLPTHIFLGLALCLMVGLVIYFLTKKVDEKPDERFYADVAKAACLTLVFTLISLMVVTLISFFVTITLHAGMPLIFGATIIFVFDLAFWYFEKRGGYYG